ncbi:trehalose-phosphatase-domain-containing protein [Mycena sanguinolenta]|nr:trehalose-phosphatase-domain-containing protein [Mycena sanguinolenta]
MDEEFAQLGGLGSRLRGRPWRVGRRSPPRGVSTPHVLSRVVQSPSSQNAVALAVIASVHTTPAPGQAVDASTCRAIPRPKYYHAVLSPESGFAHSSVQIKRVFLSTDKARLDVHGRARGDIDVEAQICTCACEGGNRRWRRRSSFVDQPTARAAPLPMGDGVVRHAACLPSASADSSTAGLGAGSQAQMRVPTSAVSEVHREALGEALTSDQPKEHDPDDDKKTEYVPVWLDDAVAHGHYDGYCKQTLWPLFHYLLWQDVAAEASSQESQYYAHYLAANTAFASAIASVYRPGDLVWVHDYHLLLVPKLLRASVPDAVIGLFVHTPFPSSEVFRCLPPPPSHQTLKKDEFYALLSVADLAVITPLRDGMNTTSTEFVIAQGRTKKSPVVLSEFMGIRKHMEHALMVNPWNLGDVAAAINEGLLMSEPEKLARHEALHKVVTTHTSHTWAAVLVKMLLGQLGGKETARRTPYLPREVLESRYHAAKKRLFFFDYDGTLAPIVKTPFMAVPSAATLSALERLSADPRNVVYIISGRDGEFLEQHLGHLKHVGFSAEHGGFMREPGQETWMGEVEEIFRYYTERTTGSVVEMKKSSITWHYRASDPEWGLFQCRQCQDLLENNLPHKRPIEVLVGKKNLEGEIVKRLLYKNPDAEFIFCAADDKTDEDMFRALILFGTAATKATMEAPLSVTLLDEDSSKGSPNGSGTATPVELAIKPDCEFTTAVGHSSKRTLASWHVTTPQEIVDHMLGLVGETAQSHL